MAAIAWLPAACVTIAFCKFSHAAHNLRNEIMHMRDLISVCQLFPPSLLSALLVLSENSCRLLSRSCKSQAYWPPRTAQRN